MQNLTIGKVLRAKKGSLGIKGRRLEKEQVILVQEVSMESGVDAGAPINGFFKHRNRRECVRSA